MVTVPSSHKHGGFTAIQIYCLAVLESQNRKCMPLCWIGWCMVTVWSSHKLGGFNQIYCLAVLESQNGKCLPLAYNEMLIGPDSFCICKGRRLNLTFPAAGGHCVSWPGASCCICKASNASLSRLLLMLLSVLFSCSCFQFSGHWAHPDSWRESRCLQSLWVDRWLPLHPWLPLPFTRYWGDSVACWGKLWTLAWSSQRDSF